MVYTGMIGTRDKGEERARGKRREQGEMKKRRKKKKRGGKDGDAMMMEESRIKGASYAQCHFFLFLMAAPVVVAIVIC